jgi:hypothetical protein
MKKIFYLALFFCLYSNLSATNYYVNATAGNDANAGTTATTAWKTINKVNSSNNIFVAGDSILFNRGDIFYGSLTINGRNGNAAQLIVYAAYGSGNQPVLRASQKVTGWVVHSGNIWKANLQKLSRTIFVSGGPVALNYRTPSLFIDNMAQRLGREPDYTAPNGGYRTIDTHSTDNKTVTEATTLPYAANLFAGAEIAIRTNRDYFNIETIVSHSGNSVTVTATNTNPGIGAIKDKFGYIIQNHIGTLNLDGEWCHDTVTNIIYIYSATDPNSRNIEVPLNPSTLTINNSSYIKVIGLRIENASYNVLNGQNDTNITIDGCYIYNSPDYGSSIFNITNSSFINNTINQANDIGFRWEDGNGILIAGNTIKNIGTWAGMGGESYIPYTGLRLISNNSSNVCTIENNILDSIGYHGINFGFNGTNSLGTAFIVRRNNVQRFCLVKDDGGGIYTTGNTNRNQVYENFVHDAPGAPLGAPAGENVKAAGIYPDLNTQNLEVFNNTIYNIATWAILVNLSSNNSFSDNTLFNCGSGIVLNTYGNSLGTAGTPIAALNNIMKRNILFTKSPAQFCAEYNNSVNPADLTANLGLLDSNYYCQPYINGSEIWVRGSSANTLTLTQFKTQYPAYEANGKPAPVKFVPGTNPDDFIRFETNMGAVAKTVDLGNNYYLDAKGKNYVATTSLPAYTSLILLKTTAPPVPADNNYITLAPGVQYKVYPNPVVLNNKLIVKFKVDTVQKFSVRLFAVNGKLLYSKRPDDYAVGTYTIALDNIGVNAVGMYLLQLVLGDKTVIKKILFVK